MDGKQLRSSILQWAIQGKLVPQDPNDESASVLLERIREEKARLVKEKKIKRDKNESIIYRGDDNSYYEKFTNGNVVCIDDEIPFDVPETWSWCRLRNVIRGTGAGKSPNCDKRPKNDDEWGVLTTTAIQYCDFLPNENKVLPANYIINQVQKVEFEDLLITRAGPRNRTGIVCVANKTCDRLILSDKTVRIEYIRNFCNPYFLMYVLNSPAIHDIIMAATVGMADSQVNISQNNIQNIVVPLPPHKEQQRIVNKLEVIIPLLKKYSSAKGQQDKLNNYIHLLIKKSILQEAIQGKLVPQDPNDEPASVLLERIREEKQQLVTGGKLKKKDIVDSTIIHGDDNKYFEKRGKAIASIDDEIPFDIPESWIWTRLSCVADIYTGNSIGETEKKLKFTNVIGRYYIGTKDVGFDNKVFYNNGVAIPKKFEHNFRIAPNNSILMCIEGGSAGRKIAILNQDVCFGNKLCCFSPFIEIGKYIYYYLQSPSFIDMFNDKKTGIIGGVSIAKVKEILIPLPPVEETKRIVSKIDELVASIMRK